MYIPYDRNRVRTRRLNSWINNLYPSQKPTTYLDCGDVISGIHICPNMKLHTLNVCNVCINNIPKKPKIKEKKSRKYVPYLLASFLKKVK